MSLARSAAAQGRLCAGLGGQRVEATARQDDDGSKTKGTRTLAELASR